MEYNALLMPEIKGGCEDWSEMIERQQKLK